MGLVSSFQSERDQATHLVSELADEMREAETAAGHECAIVQKAKREDRRSCVALVQEEEPAGEDAESEGCPDPERRPAFGSGRGEGERKEEGGAGDGEEDEASDVELAPELCDERVCIPLEPRHGRLGREDGSDGDDSTTEPSPIVLAVWQRRRCPLLVSRQPFLPRLE